MLVLDAFWKLEIITDFKTFEFHFRKTFRFVKTLGACKSASGPVNSVGFRFDMVAIPCRWHTEFLRNLPDIVSDKHLHCVIGHHSS